MDDKERLNASTQRHFYLRTFAAGCRNIVSSPLKFAGLLALLLFLRLYSAAYIRGLPPYLSEPISFCFAFASVIPLCFYICAFGYVRPAKALYDNFVRIGHTNSAGEAPYLIERHTEGRITNYMFYSKGITLASWKDRVDAVQSAMNMTVVSISQGKDFRTVTVRAAPPSTFLSKRILWDDRYLDYEHPSIFILGEDITSQQVTFDIEKQPMILIGGSTGSGKTKLALSILYQALRRNYQVTVLDFKGIDFAFLKKMDCHIETTPDGIIALLKETMDDIQMRLQTFAHLNVTNYTQYVQQYSDILMKPRIIFVDECSMLVDYGTSKEAKAFSAEVVDLLAAIARVARAVGIHLIISTQRPDANSVPGPIKSNLDLRICGKADTTLSTIILGDGRATELIPPDSQGRFVMRSGYDDIVFQSYLLDD